MENPAHLFLERFQQRLQKHREMADRALAQIDDRAFFHVPRNESNSVAMIVKHLGGNHVSRWTNFLTSDGEKPNRDRDDEFIIGPDDTRTGLMELWDRGWDVYFATLASLKDVDLTRTITIRGEPHDVIDALMRGFGHATHHIGQIVYLCKLQHPGDWEWMTIPPGGTETFNRMMADRYGKPDST